MKFETDLWQVGMVRQPISAALEAMAWPSAPIVWLPPQRSFCFLADPFGVWRDNQLTVFVEALDYRRKIGEIQYFRYTADFRLLDSGVALRQPYHLSYPYLIEDGGELYMLPEAHKSGKLTLYRSVGFPHMWEPVADLLDQPAIDASVIYHKNRWWMFYALPGSATDELQCGYAETLTGTWTPHPMNPVRRALDSARPGGTPFVHMGELYLPTQDCRATYGGAVSLLHITVLTPEAFAGEVVRYLPPPEGYDGLHTLSACGEVTLLDVKRIDHSPARRWINWQRRVARVLGGIPSP